MSPVYLPGEIKEAADAYRSAEADGRELSSAERDYLTVTLRPSFLDGSGRLDLTEHDFSHEEVAYAGLLIDLQRTGRRELSEDEATFAELAERYVYVRQIEADSIEREEAAADAIEHERAAADAELERAIQRSAVYGVSW